MRTVPSQPECVKRKVTTFVDSLVSLKDENVSKKHLCTSPKGDKVLDKRLTEMPSLTIVSRAGEMRLDQVCLRETGQLGDVWE